MKDAFPAGLAGIDTLHALAPSFPLMGDVLTCHFYMSTLQIILTGLGWPVTVAACFTGATCPQHNHQHRTMQTGKHLASCPVEI